MASYEDHIIDQLREMSEQKKIVAIHENPYDAEPFVVGYVLKMSDEQVNLRCLNPRGEDDGVEAIQIARIRSLHWDSDYLRRIQYLHEHPLVIKEPAAGILDADATNYGALLAAAFDAGAFITIHQKDSEKLSGLVSEVGDDWVEFEVILDTGQSDGWKLVPFSEIHRLDVGGVDEQVDLAVHKSRYAMGQ